MTRRDRLREDAREQLVDAILQLGYPAEFGVVLAEELRSEQAMRRMASYLRQAQPQSPEEIADEMLAIVAQRDSWVERKISEHAQASVTAFYNRDRDDD
jgi:hypothetical protein